MPHDDVLRGLRIELATAIRERDEARARADRLQESFDATELARVSGLADERRQKARADAAEAKIAAAMKAGKGATDNEVAALVRVQNMEEALAATNIRADDWQALAKSNAASLAELGKALAAARRAEAAAKEAHAYCLLMFSREWLTDPKNRSIFAARIFAMLDRDRGRTSNAAAPAAGEEGKR